jgi:hypothetical protein
MGKYLKYRLVWLLLGSSLFSFPVLASEGTLQIRANGEDFVRQGFVSKDGWQITFDHLYVSLSEVSAYQTDPPFDPQSGKELQAKTKVSLPSPSVVDLALGDEAAEPILVGELSAPMGRYNALRWIMKKATEGPAAGSTLVLIGKAVKESKTVDFRLKFDREYTYTCGDFVGDDRKGILSSGKPADLEATFHFDHVFGDAETPLEDELNKGALGFEPLAALAQAGKLDMDQATLRQKLSSSDYTTLINALDSLGHVGEGHCEGVVISTQ